MSKHLIIFCITFAVGAVIAVMLRTSQHQPYANGSAQADHATESMPATSAPAPLHHDPHAAAVNPPDASDRATVNSVCPICGDPVTAKLPYADYQGKKIGFGCAMCPPKFKTDPKKYGEAALKNQVVE